MSLILASTSPRRHELLALLGILFDVKSPSFKERLVADHPAIQQVMSFAQGKAQSVARQEPEAIVLGSDTVIELDHDVLGKPADLVESGTRCAQVPPTTGSGCDRAHYLGMSIAKCR